MHHRGLRSEDEMFLKVANTVFAGKIDSTLAIRLAGEEVLGLFLLVVPGGELGFL